MVRQAGAESPIYSNEEWRIFTFVLCFLFLWFLDICRHFTHRVLFHSHFHPSSLPSFRWENWGPEKRKPGSVWTELQARPVWHWSYAALGPLLARDAVGNHTDQGTCTGGAGILGGVDRLETRWIGDVHGLFLGVKVTGTNNRGKGRRGGGERLKL